MNGITIFQPAAENMKLAQNQLACLGRIFYIVYYYGKALEKGLCHRDLLVRFSREIAKAQYLKIPDNLVCAVISSKTDKLSDCFEEVCNG